MAEGFAAGLAGGLQTGVQLAQTQLARQIQAQREQAAEQNYQSLAESRIAAQQHQAQTDTRAAQNQQFKNLNDLRSSLTTQLSAATDPAKQQELLAQRNQVDHQLHGIFASSPVVQQAQDSRARAGQTASSLASGQQTIADLSPNDAYEFMSHSLGVPAHTVLRGPNGELSPYEQAANDFHQGLATAHLDNGTQAMSGLNGMFAHVLDGHHGSLMPDGTPVTSAQFTSPAAMPDGSVVPRVAYTGQTPDGRTATMVQPMMGADGQVHTTTMPAVLNNTNAKAAMVQVANHPDMAPKLNAATNKDEVAQHLTAGYVAAAHPEHLDPQAALARAQAQADYENNQVGVPYRVQKVYDKYGNVIDANAVPASGKGQVFADINPNQENLDQATLAEKRAQTALANAHRNQQSGIGASMDPAALAGYKSAFIATGIPALSRLPAAERNQIVAGVEQDLQHQGLQQDQITRIFANIGPRNKEQANLLTGRDGMQLQAINTLIPHLNTLSALVAARTSNTDPQAIRGLEQRFQQEFGQSAPVNTQQMAEFIRGEIGKYLNVTTGSERENLAKGLDRSLSNGQIQSAVDNIKHAMFNRLDAIKQTSDAAGNLNPFVDTYLAPTVQEQYRQYMQTNSLNTAHSSTGARAASTGLQNAIPSKFVKEGVTQADWDAMTPEQRKAFQ